MISKILNLINKIKEPIWPAPSLGYVGLWKNDEDFIKAAKAITDAGFTLVEGITPFPMHGLDKALNLKRSWLPWVTFFGGSVGCTFGIVFTWWTSAVNWPVIIGGKPMWSVPAFIPIIFELTILIAAFSTVGVLLFICCGLPRVNPPVIDKDLTCDKMAIFVSKKDKLYNETKIKEIFNQFGVKESYETSF